MRLEKKTNEAGFVMQELWHLRNKKSLTNQNIHCTNNEARPVKL